MIKRTLHFGNPAYLSTTLEQLVIRRDSKPDVTVPIEDIAAVVLDHPTITLSQALLGKLLDHNVAVVSCNQQHLPVGLLLPLEGNSVQNERFAAQLLSSEPLKKQLWRQTVQAKIRNQARLLKKLGREDGKLLNLAKAVRSGDAGNHESQAAVIYWRQLFDLDDFVRRRYGAPPNNQLNSGYAILRALVARALVAAGLLPTLGIHHHNRYNAYALADDLMEPYRPFVDELVTKLVGDGWDLDDLTPDLKRELLQIPTLEVELEGESRRLLDGVDISASSLRQGLEGSSKKLRFPVICR